MAGFTLLEVMLALVLTGLVVLVAYAAAQVSFEARTRLAERLAETDRVRAVSEFLRDALRNARSSERPSDPGFELTGDRLSFVASGSAPLDPDYDWRISAAIGSHGLEVAAIPLGHAPTARVTFRAPAITRWQVRVLALGETAWQSDWAAPTLLPRAVTITFWHDSVPLGEPLDVVLWSASTPAPADSQP